MKHEPIKISKTKLRLLERIFEWEIIGVHPYQSKDKRYLDLKRDGLVVEVERTFGTSPPLQLTVRGWALTPLGHYIYCSNCK